MGNSLGNTKIKVVILGLDNSGKSTLYNRIKNDKFILTSPSKSSICDTFTPKLKGSAINKYIIQLHDVSGNSSSRSLWPSYLHKANGIIYVIDISDNSKLEEAKVELHSLVSCEQSKYIPVLVLLNKIDQPNCQSPKRIVQFLNLSSMDCNRWWIVKSVCLVTGEEVCEALNSLADIMKQTNSGIKSPPDRTNDYIEKQLNEHGYAFVY